MAATIMSTSDYSNLPHVAPTARISYGSLAEQFGDLYMPQNGAGPFPVVIFAHGGCWMHQYDLHPCSTMAHALAQSGFAVWSIEYRRIGGAGGYPETFFDVANATDHLRKISETHKINLNQVTTVGHSAGGHLALWIAARHKLQTTDRLYCPSPLPIVGVVVLAGIPDLEESINVGICDKSAESLIGGSPAQFPERYRECSLRSLAPIHVKQIFISGNQDTLVPVDYVKKYIGFAHEKGDDITYHSFDATGHFEVVVPTTEAGKALVHALQSLYHQAIFMGQVWFDSGIGKEDGIFF